LRHTTPLPPPSTLVPYTTLFRSKSPTCTRPTDPQGAMAVSKGAVGTLDALVSPPEDSTVDTVDTVALARLYGEPLFDLPQDLYIDRKSTRLNSSHVKISYAVFCL